MRILQVNTQDIGGGAEGVCMQLHDAMLAAGHESWVAVGRRRSRRPDVLTLRGGPELSLWGRLIEVPRVMAAANAHRRYASRVNKALTLMQSPRRLFDRARGLELLDYPGTGGLLDLPPEKPDILNLHNLHGEYFDLAKLPALSRAVPTVVTLHDAWLASGHCAHSFDCTRWKIGCGACPDLTIFPSIRRDATAENWERKRAILAQCRLHVVTPSSWLLDRAVNSIIGPAMVSAQVIHNGVDTAVFRPGVRASVRRRLGLGEQDRVVLVAANGLRQNVWKDFATLRRALARALVTGRGPAAPMVCLALGEEGEEEKIGDACLRFVPFEENRALVADYFRAADVFVHATRADTFPSVVIEALACGVPVIGSSVGGVPEQIVPLDETAANADQATGLLVSVGDAPAMAAAISRLLGDASLRQRLAVNAVADVHRRFSLGGQLASYVHLYEKLCKHYPGSM